MTPGDGDSSPDDLSDLISDVDSPVLDYASDGDDYLGHRVAEDAIPDVAGQHPADVLSQPLNCATMECLRGPCIWWWEAVSRMRGPGERLMHKHVSSCLLGEEMPLGGQNVYQCSGWWPVWGEWIPKSLRAIVRPRLRMFVEKILRRKGYDFSWRPYDDMLAKLFHSDEKEHRGKSGIGGSRPMRKD